MGYTRAARPRGLPTDSATENKPPALKSQISNLGFQRVRVKRWGKSPPLQAQARRHGKPHRVQGQIGDRGAARSMPRVGQASRLSREEKTGWKPVPLCGQVPGTGCSDKWFSPRLQGWADRIRLTALPKSANPPGCESAHLSAPVCSIQVHSPLAPQLRLAEALGWINLTSCTGPGGIIFWRR